MDFIFCLLVWIAGTVSTAAICSDTRSPNVCYGALGENVTIHLASKNTFSIIFKMMSKMSPKQTERYFKCKKSEKLGWLDTRDKNWICTKGIVTLSNAMVNDSGNYSIETFGSEGNGILERTFKMEIEAPVSALNISFSCSLDGQKNVFCSSHGDNVQYSWTLDGHRIDTQWQNDDNTNVKVNTSGKITCLVENHVSVENISTELWDCPGYEITSENPSSGLPTTTWTASENGTITPPHSKSAQSTQTAVTSSTSQPKQKILIGVVSIVIALTLLAVVAFCIYRRKTKVPESPETGHAVVYAQFVHKKKEMEPPGKTDNELVYAEVSLLKNKKELSKMKREDNVEYAVVRVPGTQQTRAVAEDPLYSTLRPGQ